MTDQREGSLDAPTRHPLDWQSAEFSNEDALHTELERVFDICHGCRRCFSLCHAFPTLFDLIDDSESGELDSVPRESHWKVVEQCYLCDMCYMSKCPYVPPHPFQVDFPHLMLRAKAKAFSDGKASTRDKVLSATDRVGALAGIPVVAETVNAVNATKTGRRVLEATLGVHREAPLPKYHAKSARGRLKERIDRNAEGEAAKAGGTQGRVVVFATCYGNHNHPDLVEDLVTVLEHNGIATSLASKERCCGMPKLELGDLESVKALKEENIDELHRYVAEGWDLTAVVPSCVLMFKQELPLMFPEDEKVRAVADAFYDPFEYLGLRHKAGLMNTEFKQGLGTVSYQVPCHLRVQNIGLKTRDILQLVPDTSVQPIERCSGHDGTYAVKKEFHEISKKIARPVARQVNEASADYFTSDCPMAADQISHVADGAVATHPIQLLRSAYRI